MSSNLRHHGPLNNKNWGLSADFTVVLENLSFLEMLPLMLPFAFNQLLTLNIKVS